MSNDRHLLIQALHQAPLQLVLNITGGGTLAIPDLLTIPGGSKILLAANVPYAQAALETLLGKKVLSACSSRTAQALAMSGWQQGRQFSAADDPRRQQVVGLGCTASLVSSRPKQGEHRVYLATQTTRATRTVQMVFQKQARTRIEEERLVADFILNELAQVVELDNRLQLQLFPDELLSIDECHAAIPWQQLLTAEIPAVQYTQQQSRAIVEPVPGLAVICGAFDPVHAGHLQMARWAEQHLQYPVHFEISVANVDKPALDFCTIRDRLAQFADEQSVFLTGAGTFLEKSAIFPRATFLLGCDTFARLIHPQYYADSTSVMQQALAALAQRDCRFVIFARRNSTGSIETLADYVIPEPIQDRCIQVPASEFCLDISSTELRAQRHAR
jgi:nicotinic acid mononucleotide adenylyltransferase